MKSVLFVCLGNICRSPAAEGVARKVLADLQLSLHIDSAGTGAWHVGNPPHPTMCKVAKESGFPIEDLRARQVEAQDFERFDWIIAMDRQNLSDLKVLKARHGGQAQLSLLLESLPQHGILDVPDPYYGGEEGFHQSFSLIRQGVEAFFSKNLQR